MGWWQRYFSKNENAMGRPIYYQRPVAVAILLLLEQGRRRKDYVLLTARENAEDISEKK